MKNFGKNRKSQTTKTPKVRNQNQKISPSSLENKQPKAGM